MAAWSRKTLGKNSKFWGCQKTTPYGEILKFCSKRIHRDTDRNQKVTGKKMRVDIFALMAPVTIIDVSIWSFIMPPLDSFALKT